MADRCQYLDYRETGDGREFETPRAYCTVVERFVQPMRADVCNERYGLRPAEHCEFYREREGIVDEWLRDEDDEDGDGNGGEDENENEAVAEGSGDETNGSGNGADGSPDREAGGPPDDGTVGSSDGADP